MPSSIPGNRVFWGENETKKWSSVRTRTYDLEKFHLFSLKIGSLKGPVRHKKKLHRHSRTQQKMQPSITVP